MIESSASNPTPSRTMRPTSSDSLGFYRGRKKPSNSAIPTQQPNRGFVTELGLKNLTVLHFALAALMLISIGRVHDHLAFLAAIRPALLLVVFCVLAAAIQPSALRLDNVASAWPPKAVLALVAGAIFSSFFGLSLGASGSFMLTNMAPVLTFFFLLLLSIRNSTDLRWCAFSYILAVISVFIASIFMSDVLVLDRYARWGGVGMYDGNDIGVIYMAGLPLAFVFLRSRSRMFQVLGLITVIGILTSLTLTVSRGGFLGLLFTGLAVAALSPGWRVLTKALIVLVPSIGLLILAPEGFWNQMSTILAPQYDYNLTDETGRVAIWTRGMGYVAEFPVFGVGPDNFIRAGWSMSDVGRSSLAGVGLRDQAPHNTFLQVWAELGTVGLTIWLSILAYGIFGPLRLRRRMPKWWLTHGSPDHRFLYLMASYLPASLIGFSVTTFFVTHAYTPIFYALAAILGGLMIVGQRALRIRPGPTHQPYTSATIIGSRPS